MTSLFHSVQLVGRAVERAYKADGLTIACQVRTSRLPWYAPTY